ncbi:MAG: hypothetical protein B7Z06_02410 [Flavobacteriales bacterium 32-35-8]|nr:MAG: hypothetical protein B7Z06_02410 [Flavobacteriales bacterium 32-35-8]
MDAQIDSRNNSISIPAIESPKDSSDAKSLLPSKPIEAQNTNKGLSTPKANTQFNFPKKEFSMTGGEVFGNPGELYEKSLSKKAAETRPEGYGENAGLKEDAFWGDYRTSSAVIKITYRDYSAVDGDYLTVMVNDDIIQSNVLLTSGFKGFNLKLEEGINKIEFLALNEGASGPNTAEYLIVEEAGKIITGKIWALSKGVKVKIIIIKE